MKACCPANPPTAEPTNVPSNEPTRSVPVNILLINHYAGSSRHGMEYRPFHLARQWSRMGHQVAIVAASFSHLHVTRPETKGRLTQESIEGVRYFWLKTPPYHGNGVSRAINILAFASRLRRYRGKLLRFFRPDAVIASSPHPMIIYGARAIAGRSGAKLVFEVRDLWPLTLVELGAMSPRHPFVLLMRMAERTAYRSADRVVSLLPKADSHMREHGMAAEKFVHIPNGIDIDSLRDEAALPGEHAECLARHKRQGRFLVGYAGGHGVSNALKAVVAAAEHLRSLPVTLVLVGQGPEKESLRADASRRGLDNLVFLPPVVKDTVRRLLSEMDALYIGWNRSPIYQYGISPNKLLDYMLAGKPIVHAVEAANDPVAESGCGISCPPENPPAIARAIAELMRRTPAERHAMGKRGQQYVSRHHDYRVLAERFLAELG